MKKKNKSINKTFDAGIHVAAAGSVVGLAVYGAKKAIGK